MEPYENNDTPMEETEQAPIPPVEQEPPAAPAYEPEPPRYAPPQEYGAYHGTGAGRKESPYANSPYVRQ